MVGVACSEGGELTEMQTAVSGKFTPPGGQTLFFVGQDNDTIEAYLKSVDLPVPSGVTSYTSLERLEGLGSGTDYGAGTIHLDALAAQQPESAIALGLYLVDYLDEINSGLVDDRIDVLLDYLSGLNRPIFLRFGYEFEGPWNRYDPDEFVSAWIRFHDRMTERGDSHIAFVWQSANACAGRFTGAELDTWYPGDEYVDWVGISWFTQSDCGNEPIDEMLLFAREHDKPLMIAESAPQRYAIQNLTQSSNGGAFTEVSAETIWNEWYQPFFDFIETNQDIVRAVAYINTFWDEQAMWGPPYRNGYWGDSRVQANELILDRWQTELSKPLWLHGSDRLFSTLNQ